MRADKEYRLGFTERAKQIVNSLTLEQKVYLMSGNVDLHKMTPAQMQEMMEAMTKEENHYNVEPYEAGGLSESKVPPMRFVDGPRGVVCGNGQSTCFPVSMARGASFDTDLEERIGRSIGKEVRAFGGNLFAGVCVNLPYHPGWGRSQETYGEESFQIGQMGAALVKGVQEEDVIACVKHFAFNSMENARFKCSVTCDARTEQEVFLPHFKDCIDAGAASVMSAYNRYQGEHCGHSKYLLNQVLKKEWDFDGFVMSDFVWGIRDTVEAANGGQDMEMMWTQLWGDRLIQAVKEGFVPEEKINEAALRIVRTMLSFDQGHKDYDMSVVGCKEHIALAKEAAQKSITLLKNDGQLLPLKKEEVKKLALIGKLADKENIGDHGSSQVRPAYIVTPLQGLQTVNPDCEILYADGTDLEYAKRVAENADAVIFVVGYDHDDEGEFISENQAENYTGAIGGDRKCGLNLHEEDIHLIREVGSVNDRSVVVLIGGNTIMLSEWYDTVSAVMMAYYPGMEGGTAIAEIIYGDVNPSGKLPFVIPEKEEDLPYVDWEATDQYYEYYHGYTRLDKNGKKAKLPYGFGMSYTSFEITKPSVSVEKNQIVVCTEVTNTGGRYGEEVVQLYAGFENSKIDRPLRQLRGFARVSLNAGETKRVKISTPIEKLKWYNPVRRVWELEEMAYHFYVGNSSAMEDLKGEEIFLTNKN